MDVAAGYYHSLGLKEDGSIVAWGWNAQGQCTVPAPNTGFVDFSGGGYHSLGLKEDSSIVAWGYNYYGQCTVPAPNTDFVDLAGGLYHSLGLHGYGTSVEDSPFPQDILQINSCFPNPFCYTTTVMFQSPEFDAVRLEVFDTSGRLVSNRELGQLAEGQNSFLWAGCGSGGETLADGVYLIRLVSGSGDIASARIVLLR